MPFLVHEDFDNDILRGVYRIAEENALDFDAIRVQDVPQIYQQPDPVVLEWAATENRILLTHDRNTMTAHVSKRLAHGLLLPGAFIDLRSAPISEIIDELVTIIGASDASERTNIIQYLPIR